ncbi:MAG: RNA polymerase sigma factor region1.1 domain-containing protein, partial [Chloroflexota bacterium]|nr:RNA polymerase sigma factor region1.1 domain-containing protein [Chloroflexota bacterium]
MFNLPTLKPGEILKGSERWREDHEKELETLLDRAETQGYLSIGDLTEIFPKGEDDVEGLSIIMMKLRKQGIDIYDQASLSESVLKSEEDTQPIKRVALDQVRSDDTVGLYLKEMSQVPLLSLEEE